MTSLRRLFPAALAALPLSLAVATAAHAAVGQLGDEQCHREADSRRRANSNYLSKQAATLGSAAAPAPALAAMEAESRSQASKLDSKDNAEWNVSRKKMKEEQFKLEKQQR